MSNFWGAVHYSEVGSLITELSGGDFSVVASMYRASLYDGSKQFFPVGTAASNLLQNDPVFRDLVLSVGTNLEPMTGQAVRIDFKPERTSAKVAFGHLKLAAYLYKNPDGGIGVVGVAKDAYNFEWWGYKSQLDEYNLNNLYDE